MSDEQLLEMARTCAADPADDEARDRYEGALARAGRGVFLVWAGEYSSAYVTGAYTSRAKAQAVIDIAAVVNDQSYGAGPDRMRFCDLDEHRSWTRCRGAWAVEIDSDGKR